MNKQELRNYYLGKRKAYTLDYIEECSREIAEQLWNWEKINWFRIRCVHVFLSIKKNNEINTAYIMNGLIEKFPHIKVALSVSDFENKEMEMVAFQPDIVWEENAWGIPEPVGGQKIQPEEIDVMIMPLVAFDKQGNRLGYGKGFYDRYLSRCRKDCLKLGLSVEEPLGKIEANVLDVRIDAVINPKCVYEF